MCIDSPIHSKTIHREISEEKTIHMPLTDLEIRRAKPSEKAYTKADGKGLSLQIEPNGSKGWRFRYRFEGKAKMLSLGTYPKVSLSEARKKRDEAQELLAAGINPSDSRKEKKLAQQDRLGNTVKVIAKKGARGAMAIGMNLIEPH